MNEKQEIEKIIADYPKHFSVIIQNKEKLWQWVVKNSLIQSGTAATLIYSAINQESDQCIYGNTKKFGSIKSGFKFCGPTSICQCAKEAISKKVSQTKSKRTAQEIDIENKKRELTNLKKYGVTNTGQTEYAKSQHSNFYSSKELVSNVTKKIKNTKLKNHGNANYNNRNKATETYLEKYGVTTPLLLQSVRDNMIKSRQSLLTDNFYLKQGYQKFKKYISENYDFTLLTPEKEYFGIHQKDAKLYKFQCNKCLSVIEHKFYHSSGLNCEKCNPKLPSFTSNEEQQIFDFITNELNIEGIQGDKTIINPYELDMVFEDHKIAIEYCGLYWHSELSSGKNKKYHQTKMNLANSKGYRLITIFSDEWLHKQNIVKNRLMHIFGKTKERIFARNTCIKEVSITESRDFLEKYHLQGYSHAPIRYGLYYKNQLVSLMTFSKPRKALNSHGKEGYELVRYATDGTSIVGGASKLLSHFIKNHYPKKITSYADLRWSDGKLYRTLGFKLIKTTQPGYYYVENYEFRRHRYNFTKQKLIKEGYNPNITEWEIMQIKNYDRIWDCGNLVFELDLS
jgi:hypothetical protein